MISHLILSLSHSLLLLTQLSLCAGVISDCDVSAPWKYSRTVRDYVDLALNPNPFNPMRHEVPAGSYRFAVLQTCLENLDNAPIYATRGADMRVDHTWGGANVTDVTPEQRAQAALGNRPWPNKCFHLMRPFAEPLVIEHGDQLTLTLTYNLHGTCAALPSIRATPPCTALPCPRASHTCHAH